MAKKTEPTPADYEKLGRTVASMLVDDYLDLLGNTKRQLKSAFLRGIAAGLGTVIGATIIVALVVWILHVLGGVPVVGHYLQGAGSQIQQR